MANTVEKDGSVMHLILDSDFDYNSEFPREGVNLHSIQFSPGATDDELFIHEKTITGAIMFHAVGADAYDQKVKYFGDKKHRPAIDFSECTLSAGHVISLILGD